MHPEVAELLEALNDVSDILTEHGASTWSSRVKQAADHIAKSDAYGVKLFLDMFGGTGSLNDLIVGDSFATALSKAYALADRLRHEAY